MIEPDALTVAVLDMQPIDPPVGGGRLRLLGLYHGLGPRLFARYVGSYDWPGPGFRQQLLSDRLEEMLVPLSAAHFAAAKAKARAIGRGVVIDTTFHELAHLSPDYVSAVRAVVAAANIVVMSHPWAYPLVRDLIDVKRQLLVYDAQNMEGLLRAELLDDGNHGTAVVRGVVAVESELCQAADLVLACSYEDRDAFARIYEVPCAKLRVVGNGTFTKTIIPSRLEAKATARVALGIGLAPVAFFLGSHYAPNVEASRFIAQALAPVLPEVLFVIAGGVGDALATETHPANLRITGRLSEFEKHNWLGAADVAINPMFNGSGTNIKMLEFMASGLCIVTTPVGARGIDTEAQCFVVAEAQDFADALAKVLSNPERALELGRIARREAERGYSWERLSCNVGQLLKRRAGTLGKRPLVSVVVSAEDTSELTALMQQLAHQTFHDFEVVVIDQSETPWPDHSRDFGFDLVYVHSGIKGSARARNEGAMLATGEIIAFTEADCAPDLDWLKGGYAAFAAKQIAGLEGRVDRGSLQEVDVADLGFPFANLFVRADIFHRVGGCKLAFAEDDLAWRVQRYGDIPFSANVCVTQARRPVVCVSNDHRRLGWVSSWQVPCGIAEYSRYLVGAMETVAPGRGPHVIFSDDRTPPGGEDTERRVVPSWEAGGSNFDRLAEAITRAAPEILVVQHHPALIPWATLSALLRDSRLAQLDIFVTLHNVRNVLDNLESQESLVRALRGVAGILVHSADDLGLLRELTLSRNVMLFPHGARAVLPGPPVRVLSPNTAPVIGCFGFFMPHKGIYALIQATDTLRLTWPGLRLRLVNAVYPRQDSEQEIARCQQLAGEIGLDSAIEWITDFIADELALAQLRGCDLVVLPYGSSQESSSAALRMVLASGAPVAVSREAIFNEAESAVARLPSADALGIAEGVKVILRDAAYREEIQNTAARWMEQRAWPRVAARLTALLYHDHTSAHRFAFVDRREQGTACPSNSNAPR